MHTPFPLIGMAGSADPFADVPAIEVRHVSKTYRMWSSPLARLMAPLWYRAAHALRRVAPASAGRMQEAVDRRLSELPSLRADSTSWTSWKGDDGLWTVEVSWHSRSRTRSAQWRYDVAARTVVPVDPASASLGHVDEEGFLYVSDRLKDMIISGGENVYPAEVEAVIMELPQVASVAVIGIPDEKWGEVPRAVIELADGAALDAAALRSHLDGRLARYKIPRTVEFVGELPRTASGKIRKATLRTRATTTSGSGRE